MAFGAKRAPFTHYRTTDNSMIHLNLFRIRTTTIKTPIMGALYRIKPANKQHPGCKDG